MQTIYKSFFIVLLFSSLVGCRKEIPFDNPDSERKIVLNALLWNDSLFSAQLYKSGLVTDRVTTPLFVNNATVSVYNGHEFVETLGFVSDGFYKSTNAKAIAGNQYTLKVSVPSMKEVSGVVKVEQPVQILAFDSVGVALNEWDEPMIKLNVTFQDDASQKNYYRLSLYTYTIYYNYGPYYPEIVDSTMYFGKEWIETNDPALEAEYDGSFYFSDALFNGKEYSFELLKNEYSYNNSSKYFYAVLEHISYDFYRYSISLPAHFDAEDMKFFMEAVLVYNNIENGLGIIGSASVAIDSIYNKNYIKQH